MMTPRPLNMGSSTKLDRADVAVVIINYGTADLALQAVDSVLGRDHCGLQVEVHLVDNASPGDDAARLGRALEDSSRAGRVTFYPEMTNHGFGRGNNIVLRALTGRPHPPRFVFLLNPDARLKSNTIVELANFLNDHPKAAAVGAGIDRPDGGPSVTAAFRFPSLISEFASAVQLKPLTQLTSRWSVPLPPTTPTQQVDWISGACIMARFESLQDVDFFDPDFFLYFEETELMYRLHKADWEIWHCAEARIEHVAGAATGIHAERTKPLPDFWFESWRFYFCKTQNVVGVRLCALARLGGSILHVAIATLRRRQPSSEADFVRKFFYLVVRPLFLSGSR